MILTFTNTDKTLKGKIKSKQKTHSIIPDKQNKWETDMYFHFWMGEPNNIKENPHAFGEGIVAKVLEIYINPITNMIQIKDFVNIGETEDLNKFAVKEGYNDWEEMKTFYPQEFVGRLILWKDCKWYDDDKTRFMHTYETISKNQEFMSGETFDNAEEWLLKNEDKYLTHINEKPILWEGYRYIKKIVLTETTTIEEIAAAMDDRSLTLYMTDLTNEEEYENAHVILTEIKRREKLKNIGNV